MDAPGDGLLFLATAIFFFTSAKTYEERVFSKCCIILPFLIFYQGDNTRELARNSCSSNKKLPP